jgi:superfamily II DNA/RNA helicase
MSQQIKEPEIKKYYDNVNIGKRTKQVVYLANEQDKAAMVELFLKNSDKKQTIIITKSKRRADELSAYLKTKELPATAIHGNHRAVQIEEASKAFNSGELKILVTTDMILQSLELNGIQTIISYDLSSNHEEYFSHLVLVDEVGESILFVAPEEEATLSIIEIKLKNKILQEELEGFVPADDELFIHSSKEKTKKPRHQKKKTKTKKEKF